MSLSVAQLVLMIIQGAMIITLAGLSQLNLNN